MKTKFLSKQSLYDGQQLKPLWAYLNHALAGDSIVSWVGPCNIPTANMVDAEDQVEKSQIKGALMLHFIVEVFDRELFSAVAMQRMFAGIAKDYLNEQVKVLKSSPLLRDGDDLYWKNKKLSISIASRSAVSCQIHFAMNITNKGTPVETCALEDFSANCKTVATDLMELFAKEYESIRFATQKVHPLG